MPKMVALLRGINVGGHKKIKMAELRSALEQSGLKSVQSYIQSGNLLFESAKQPMTLENQIHKAIESEFGFDVPVMVRPASFFSKVVSGNPFPKQDSQFLCAAVLSESPKKKYIDAIGTSPFGNDQFKIVKDVVYIHCPSGFGRTKLTNGFFEKKLYCQATSRNWKTINKLIELAKE